MDTANRPGGWYFQTARSVTDLWGDCLHTEARGEATAWGVSSYTGLECTQRSTAGAGAGTGGEVTASAVIDVVECIFTGGHVCNLDAQWGPIYAFMSSHSRVGGEHTTCPAPKVPTPSTCGEGPLNSTSLSTLSSAKQEVGAGIGGAECTKNTECCSNRCKKDGTCK